MGRVNGFAEIVSRRHSRGIAVRHRTFLVPLLPKVCEDWGNSWVHRATILPVSRQGMMVFEE